MTMKRPYSIQHRDRTARGTVYYATVGTNYAHLANAIKEAQRLKADRVYNVATKTVAWERGA